MPRPTLIVLLLGSLALLAVSSCDQDVAFAKSSYEEPVAPRQLQLEYLPDREAPKPTKVLLDILVDGRLDRWSIQGGADGLVARKAKDAGPGRYFLPLL